MRSGWVPRTQCNSFSDSGPTATKVAVGQEAPPSSERGMRASVDDILYARLAGNLGRRYGRGMKTLLVASMLSICTASMGFAAETTKQFACMQQKPDRQYGYVIEEGTLKAGRGYAAQITGFGTGLLTSEGDGTANQGYLYNDGELLLPAAAERARSAQWKNAIPFVIPVPNTEDAFVLYVMPEHFKPSRSEYYARLKVTRAGRELNYSLMCNDL